MKVLVLVLVLVLDIWSWSWSRSWRKSLAVFQDFCCNSMAFCERQQKQFAIRKPLFEKTFCAQCTSNISWERISQWGYLLGYTDASKAQCIDCGKLFHSVATNQESKLFTTSRIEMSYRKMPQRYLYTVHEESGIPSTRTMQKNAKLDEVGLLAAHCRADLVTECMKRTKTLILSGNFRLHFSAENEWTFSLSFRFRP